MMYYEFDESATVHSVSTTRDTGRKLPSSEPLYYSYSMISEKEAKVYASKDDVWGGD